MLSREDVKCLDINSESAGVGVNALMENAGRAVAKSVEDKFGKGLRIAVAIGKGNNGGDGLVAARHLSKENDVNVILAYSPDTISSKLWQSNFSLKRLTVPKRQHVAGSGQFDKRDVIVDALLGIGSSGDPRQPISGIIEEINASAAKRVSVDVPSGFGSEFCVNADMTVTFHDKKEGMAQCPSCGDIKVCGIGIPSIAQEYCGPGELAYFPVPKKGSHKGQNGRVLIIGGGPYTGAPLLSALAALRVGADLASIAAPKGAIEIIAAASPDIIPHKVGTSHFKEQDTKKLITIARSVDAVVIGPGMGDNVQTRDTIHAFLAGYTGRVVVDADAILDLKQTDALMRVLRNRPSVVTPHMREFCEMTGMKAEDDNEKRKNMVIEAANTFGTTILQKGAVDVISDGMSVRLNTTGSPGMTVGGTGDVLSGVVAGLMSKGARPYHAARCGAYLNGLAGEIAYQKYSYGVTASDVIKCLPLALKDGLKRIGVRA